MRASYDPVPQCSDILIQGHSVSKLAEMTAVGLGLPAEYFSDAGRYGFVNVVLPRLEESTDQDIGPISWLRPLLT